MAAHIGTPLGAAITVKNIAGKITEHLEKCTTGWPVILTEGTSLKLTENRQNDCDVSKN